MPILEDKDHNGTTFDEGVNLGAGVGGTALALMGGAGVALGGMGVGLSGLIASAGPEAWPLAAAIGLPSLAVGGMGGLAAAGGAALAANGAGGTEFADTVGDWMAGGLGLSTPVAPGTPAAPSGPPSLADTLCGGMNPFEGCF